eukprot:gnl/TRDRNA2_/TRDRNA2_28385_c0_seq1.p1 gnl/TRDRNA2_/TRDRNA2_28385_c0~~gnl/TRDRNA2_/TRDRNA2_28385_c0_seq1.p1  ORF type:complete len:682 (-),score=94.24 gnl/TRDRNA2_/TRDRNA2_28385_c0_seq1:153-2198(-)
MYCNQRDGFLVCASGRTRSPRPSPRVGAGRDVQPNGVVNSNHGQGQAHGEHPTMPLGSPRSGAAARLDVGEIKLLKERQQQSVHFLSQQQQALSSLAERMRCVEEWQRREDEFQHQYPSSQRKQYVADRRAKEAEEKAPVNGNTEGSVDPNAEQQEPATEPAPIHVNGDCEAATTVAVAPTENSPAPPQIDKAPAVGSTTSLKPLADAGAGTEFSKHLAEVREKLEFSVKDVRMQLDANTLETNSKLGEINDMIGQIRTNLGMDEVEIGQNESFLQRLSSSVNQHSEEVAQRLQDQMKTVESLMSSMKNNAEPIEETLTFEETMKRYLAHPSSSLEESVWDAALYIGSPVIGGASSCMTAFALLLNVFAQIFFCIMATGPMIKDMKLDKEEVNLWRQTAAHSRDWHDFTTGTSLVSRVCADDGSLSLASLQTDTVHDISLYQDRLFGDELPPVGVLLSTLTIWVWVLTMAPEFVAIFKHLVAYSKIPKRWQNTEFVVSDSGAITIRYIAWRRCIMILCLLVIRLAIACTLLVSGAIWLCKTYAVPDLVLNGAALAFILDLDELIFNTIVPVGAEILVRNLEPIPCGKMVIWRGLELRSVVTIIGTFAFVVAMALSTGLPFAGTLENIMGYMCGGDRNFYFEQLPNGTVAFVSTAEKDWTAADAVGLFTVPGVQSRISGGGL